MIDVRDAKIDDIEKMCKVNTKTWITTYKDILPKDILEKRIQSEKQRIINTKKDLLEHSENIKLVGLYNDNIVGMSYAGLSETSLFPDSGEIYNIYILKEYQKLGLGKLMFYKAIEKLIEQGYKDLVIKCLKDNKSCLFYEKLNGKLITTINTSIYGYNVLENIYYYKDMKELVKKK